MKGFPWSILGISATSDTRSIKSAYARLIKQHRPDDDPQQFQQIRAAYTAALEYARTPSVESDISVDSGQNNVIDADLSFGELNIHPQSFTLEPGEELTDTPPMPSQVPDDGMSLYEIEQRIDANLRDHRTFRDVGAWSFLEDVASSYDLAAYAFAGNLFIEKVRELRLGDLVSKKVRQYVSDTLGLSRRAGELEEVYGEGGVAYVLGDLASYRAHRKELARSIKEHAREEKKRLRRVPLPAATHYVSKADRVRVFIADLFFPGVLTVVSQFLIDLPVIYHAIGWWLIFNVIPALSPLRASLVMAAQGFFLTTLDGKKISLRVAAMRQALVWAHALPIAFFWSQWVMPPLDVQLSLGYLALLAIAEALSGPHQFIHDRVFHTTAMYRPRRKR